MKIFKYASVRRIGHITIFILCFEFFENCQGIVDNVEEPTIIDTSKPEDVATTLSLFPNLNKKHIYLTPFIDSLKQANAEPSWMEDFIKTYGYFLSETTVRYDFENHKVLVVPVAKADADTLSGLYIGVYQKEKLMLIRWYSKKMLTRYDHVDNDISKILMRYWLTSLYSHERCLYGKEGNIKEDEYHFECITTRYKLCTEYDPNNEDCWHEEIVVIASPYDDDDDEIEEQYTMDEYLGDIDYYNDDKDYFHGGGGGGGALDGNQQEEDEQEENPEEEEEEPAPCPELPTNGRFRIAPAHGASGIGASRFGCSRSGSCFPDAPQGLRGTGWHGGIDITTVLGQEVNAMVGGTVHALGYDPDGFGYWTMIDIILDGAHYIMLYGHLKEHGRPGWGTTISAGESVGVSGISGNLGGNLRSEENPDGTATQHTHIEIRARDGLEQWNNLQSVDPEEVLSLNFNDEGYFIGYTMDCESSQN